MDEWIAGIIDSFASEYGWAKRAILNDVYMDEALRLQKKIVRRKSNHYLMLLNIAHNPYRKKEDMGRLFDMLMLESEDEKPKELDKTAFDLLRRQLQTNNQTKIIVK